MSRSRILAVDDNRDVLAVVEQMLHGREYEIVTATGGVAALRALAESHFELVLLDIMMPDLDGLEVLRRLRRLYGRRPAVILVTAKARDGDLLAGYELGADYYITKPFTAEQLLYGIELVVESADGHRPPARLATPPAGCNNPRDDRRDES